MPELSTILSDLFDGKTVKAVTVIKAHLSSGSADEAEDVLIFEMDDGVKVGIAYYAIGQLTDTNEVFSH